MSRTFDHKRELFFDSMSSCKTPRDYSLENFKDGERYEVDITAYLQNFTKPEWQNKINVAHYIIFLSVGYGWDNRYGNRVIYRDAKFNFIFLRLDDYFKFNPIACIGFDINIYGKDNSVLIYQIQGVLGKQSELMPFRWEKMLVKIAID